MLLCFFLFHAILFAQTKNENDLLIKKVKGFYDWYKKNNTSFDNFTLYKGNGENDAPPYKIQWGEVEKYFAYIRKNIPALGQAFITWHRNDFKRIDAAFKQYPTDEIPVGFDYERIVGGQVGVDEALEYAFPAEGKWFVTIKGNTALVTYAFKTIDYETNKTIDAKSQTELKKENGIWKISRTIAMMEADTTKEEEKKASGTTI
jgi:hypothetical protein